MRSFAIVLILSGATGLFAFRNGLTSQETNRGDLFSSSYLPGLADCIGQCDALVRQIKERSVADVELYNTLRLKIKAVEHWLAYLDESYYLQHINGAPLPKIDPNAPRIELFQPKGLQRIDELINEPEDIAELANQLETLSLRLSDLYKRHTHLTYQPRYMYEACRRQIIRIYTLGITGFDTPGTLSGLTDCRTSLESMARDLRTSSLGMKTPIISQMNEAASYIQEHPDFDQFDRLHFLKTYINPIYAALLQDQKEKHIELPHQVSSLPNPVNYEAANMFDVNFLNTAYFGLDAEQLGVNEKAIRQLGEMLFLEPALSADNQRACASCHNPSMAFSDGYAKSLAFSKNGTVLRNSPTIINAVYADKYFHDLRAPHLIDQVNHVVGSEKEFNTSFGEIVQKLSSSREYVLLFKEAFPKLGERSISQYSISFALAAYVQSITGFNSTFDRYVRGDLNKLDESVVRGYNLFSGKAGCATCHFPPTFSGLVPPLYMESESEILGVPENPYNKDWVLDTDPGRFGNGWATERAEIYRYAFKTPTVRNIELTAPYMHNGAFNTLEDVMDFYNEGGGAGHGISVPYQTLPSDSLRLNPAEIRDIIVFMKSLTDTSGLHYTVKQLPPIPGIENRTPGGQY